METRIFDWDALPLERRDALEPIHTDVAAILKQRFRKQFKRANHEITLAIDRLRAVGYLYEPGITDPDTEDEKLRHGFETILKIMSSRRQFMLDRYDVVNGPEHHRRHRSFVEEAGGLIDIVNGFYSRMPPTRKPDPRSIWHFGAQYFADSIEEELKDDGIEIPTRDSIKSPVLLAVADLLRLAGQEKADEAIRVAIVGKSRLPNFS